jgi:hypothetical protein
MEICKITPPQITYLRNVILTITLVTQENSFGIGYEKSPKLLSVRICIGEAKEIIEQKANELEYIGRNVTADKRVNSCPRLGFKQGF